MTTPDNQPPQPSPVPPAPKVTYINFLDSIDVPKVKALMALCTQVLTQHKPDVLYFLFSSQGGQVNAGITLYHFLKGLPVKIVMHNTGSIDSIATVIFLAGEERYAAYGTSFHFHGVGQQINGQTRLNASALSEMHSRLREDEKKIAALVSRSTSLSQANLKKLFAQGEAKNLDFALEKGIIHEVRDVSIPRNAQLLSINLQ